LAAAHGRCASDLAPSYHILVRDSRHECRSGQRIWPESSRVAGFLVTTRVVAEVVDSDEIISQLHSVSE